MLGRNMNVCATNRTLKLGPVALDAVGMRVAVRPHILRMIDRAMVKAATAKRLIGAVFVGTNSRALLDVANDRALQNFDAPVLDNASDDVAATLKHSEHDGLVIVFRRVTVASVATADQRFVNLDMAAKLLAPIPVRVRRRHQLAKFVRHAPRRFVGAADLALQFLRRNPVARAGHQVHGKKPVRQLRAGLVKDRPRARVDVMAALLAGKAPAGCHGVKLSLGHPTGRAGDLGPAVLDVHHGHQAGRVVRDLGLELLESIFHGRLPYLLRGPYPHAYLLSRDKCAWLTI